MESQINFAKIRRKTKNRIQANPKVNNVDDAISEATTIYTYATVEVQVYQIDAMIRQHSIYDANYDLDYDDFDNHCVAVISDSGSLRKIEPVKMHLLNSENQKKH